MKCKTIILGALLAFPSCVMAQGWTGVDKEIVEKWNPLDSLSYSVEIQGSVSRGRTPLWLNANKYGLSSLDKTNGYVRGGVFRPLSVDDGRKFGLGYAVDVAVPVNYTSKVVLQQAYVEGRWLHGSLTIGAKEEPMRLKNALPEQWLADQWHQRPTRSAGAFGHSRLLDGASHARLAPS